MVTKINKQPLNYIIFLMCYTHITFGINTLLGDRSGTSLNKLLLLVGPRLPDFNVLENSPVRIVAIAVTCISSSKQTIDPRLNSSIASDVFLCQTATCNLPSIVVVVVVVVTVDITSSGPAQHLIDTSVCCVALLQVHEDFLRRTSVRIWKVQL